MSLHASIDPVAQRALDAQRRRSTAASIVVSLLGVTLIALVLGFIALKALVVEAPDIIVNYPEELPPDHPPRPQVTTSLRNPSPPSSAAMPFLRSASISPFSVPSPDLPADSPGFVAGLGDDFGDSCLSAVVYLIDRAAKQDGRFPDPAAGRHWPYEQAIATYALAEAHTMCRALAINIPNLAETVQRSGQMLIDRQHASGGWDYDYEEDSSRGGDLSITAWHIQALKACKLSGIEFRNLTRCLKRSLDYVEARQAADGSLGYTGTSPAGDLPHPSLTGAGMLSLQMGGRENSAAVRHGARHALENSPFTWDGPDCDLYAHYYLAQAMFQRGGKDWATYQPRIRDSLTARQSPDGSWPKPGGGAKVHAVGALFTNDSPTGIHYRTTLATLMLEVYYRYLPTTR